MARENYPESVSQIHLLPMICTENLSGPPSFFEQSCLRSSFVVLNTLLNALFITPAQFGINPIKVFLSAKIQCYVC